MSSLSSRLICAAALAMGVHSAAAAGVLVNISQSGDDVVTNFDGAFDVTGLTQLSSLILITAPQIRADTAFYTGAAITSPDARLWSGLVGPSAFGTGTTVFDADSAFGDVFGFNFNFLGQTGIFLDKNYASGSTLSGGTIFTGQTLASLGLTAGTYVYAAPNDTLTFIIGNPPTGVPEPDSWVMLLLGFGLAGSALRVRRATVPKPVYARS